MSDEKMKKSSEWGEFKEFVEKEVRLIGQAIYRGQSNTEWDLITTYHRTGQTDITLYFEKILPFMADRIGTITGKQWDLSKPEQRSSLLTFLQHHGFPTPLLDWTHSPYIAVYFALADSNNTQIKSDSSSVFMFDAELWLTDYKQVYNYNSPEKHVSIIQPPLQGNYNYIIQQSVFMFTNIVNITKHIKLNEKKEQYLYEWKFYKKDHPYIMRELDLMNINAMTLFPGVEGMCKKFREDFFTLVPPDLDIQI